MSNALRSFVLALVIASLALASAGFGSDASAITLDNVLGQAQTGLAGNKKGKDACLTAVYVQQLNQFYNNAQGQIQAIGQQVFQEMQGKIKQLAFCLVGAAFGFSSALRCTADLKNDTEKYFRQDLKKKTIDDAKARAQARCMLDDTTNKMRRVLKENGRDGTSTYPESYRDVLLSAEARGRAIARNNICSTQFCPWIANEMYALYNCSPDDVVALTEPTEDGREPFTQQAACSFGGNVLSGDLNNRPDLIFQLTLPQNNIWGAYMMAQEEVNRQVELAQQADVVQLQSNGGHFGVEGECTRNKEGVCLVPGRIKTPGSSLNNADQAIQQAELDWITGTKETNQLLADTSAKIVSRLIDAGFAEIPTTLELDSFANDPPPPPPTPAPTPPVTYVDPDNPAAGPQQCTPHPGCVDIVCELDDQQRADFDVVVRGTTLKDAMGKAALQNPDIVVNNTVLPGRNRDYIRQVCFQLSLRSCGPSPKNDDIIKLGLAKDIYVDIIRADGGIRFGNPTPRFACDIDVVY